MYLIPAIDLIDAKCVRLTQGDYDRKKVYDLDPLEAAKQFADHGASKLHVVDLDGARGGGIVNHRVLERLASQTELEIDWGGGMKSDDDIRIAFEAGAHQVTGGTVAVKAPATFLAWLERYGPERIILGADVKDGRVAVSGWAEASQRELFEFLNDYRAEGVRYVVCTDVSKDGMLAGSAHSLYAEIRETQPDLKLIASGGVAGPEDLDRLNELGCHGAIVGKAFYEGRLPLDILADFD